ncbi:hypothetical protein AVR91_0207765 [Amycolatopsis keratiniphila subsp. keratiniphila]|uniref:IclR-ED domain-containing protein n=1 Tax=Amycolatopsis keratiniphila subsp. keratiniphila TaxID=227715 RepID=A0A1W2M0H0_9PSEU|nr:IclR family transcriptional regulator C-terminal domain-containing protein [Amycolatopsis keratiniphila]ONF73158.1 hypothetical protein AVR91_0207765 [Amycolatopsis keratiniphila subsp. keratiniphila]
MPILYELQPGTGETIHLAAADGRELVLLERLDTTHSLRVFLPLGYRIPLDASARRTIVDPDALRARLAGIRARGRYLNQERLSDGIVAVGAAILDADAPPPPIGAVSVSGPTVRMVDAVFDEHGRAVAEAAHRITRELGAAL